MTIVSNAATFFRSRAPALDVYSEVVEVVESSREAAHATSRTLRDDGEAPLLGNQKVQNAVRLSKIYDAQNERLCVQGRHNGAILSVLRLGGPAGERRIGEGGFGANGF